MGGVGKSVAEKLLYGLKQRPKAWFRILNARVWALVLRMIINIPCLM